MQNLRSCRKYSARFAATSLMISKSLISSMTLASLTIGHMSPAAHSQDAYGGGAQDDCHDRFTTGSQKQPHEYDLSNRTTGSQNICSDKEDNNTDQFTAPCPNTGEDTLMGRKEFNELVTLPDGRDVLGLSFCDLTCNRIVIEDIKNPSDFPPLPKSIKLPESACK